MKAIAKVLEDMLTKPSTPRWNTEVPVLRPQIRPDAGWGWGGP
jgi:hypothetical protein